MDRLSKSHYEKNGNYVTVVPVGEEESEQKNKSKKPDSDYVTVLTIGDENCKKSKKVLTEEVLVYRLPGEILGFGLRFEGGTKSEELVKRLFIQTCAPDSPASRVLCTWGKLMEGDEVLEIDSLPISSMTRAECVGCLKNSKVVIKLLMKRVVYNLDNSKPYPHSFSENVRSIEDLPQVVSAEKKRMPPPPPPVPPRKIPRKLAKKKTDEILNESSNQSIKQTPECAVRKSIASFSPEIFHQRPRKISEGSIGPPDAEIYTDLFSQESMQSLSESDDTASTVSTVIDQTTASSLVNSLSSSLAGSLPSTPPTQRHMDLSNFDLANLLNTYEDEENETIDQTGLQPVAVEDKFLDQEIEEICSQHQYVKDDQLKIDLDVSVKAIESDLDKIEQKDIPPPIPPRTRDVITEHWVEGNNRFPIRDENMNIFTLPRLVDFVPKSTNNNADQNNIKNLLDNEKSIIDYSYDDDFYDDDEDAHWKACSTLATIGEVEEEVIQEIFINRAPTQRAPVVIVESAGENSTNECSSNEDSSLENSLGLASGMEAFPSNISKSSIENDEKNKEFKKKSNTNSSCNNLKDSFGFNKLNTLSNNEKSVNASSIGETKTQTPIVQHVRSRSLSDLPTEEKTNDPWTILAEHRKKGFSKLKGLVIPDPISESEVSPICIPVINSSIPSVSIEPIESRVFNETPSSYTERVPISLKSPPWDEYNLNVPKYSPAFKRKGLQLCSSYSTEKITEAILVKGKEKNLSLIIKSSNGTDTDHSSIECSMDSAKSFESSPTRSDYSFDFVNSISKNLCQVKVSESICSKKKLSRSEDESDNDSAVSSSQSSYISRPSPSVSPAISGCIDDFEHSINRLQPPEDHRRFLLEPRHLKPSSVEAINRKNILASAKCRSGKDLKIGSPVINRKIETPLDEVEEVPSKEFTHPKEEANIQKQVNKAFDQVDSLAKEIKNVKTSNQYPMISRERKSNGSVLFDRKVNARRINLTNGAQIPTVTVREQISKFNQLSKYDKVKSVTDLKKTSETSSSVSPTPKPSPRVSVKTPSKEEKRTSNRKTEIYQEVDRNKERFLTKIKKSEKIQSLPNTKTINLNSDGSSNIGITLAESEPGTKYTRVHRIRYGSLAYQEGTLTKGDYIVAVNGKSTEGLSQEEAEKLLKDPVEKLILVVQNNQKETPKSEGAIRRKSVLSENHVTNISAETKKANLAIVIEKEGGAGLGFSMDGGKDSPQGDVSLTVKKIFVGGSADKGGKLNVGDEIIAINESNIRNMSKIQVWNLMKKLPDGIVTIHVFR